jgi:hypothetical protein
MRIEPPGRLKRAARRLLRGVSFSGEEDPETQFESSDVCQRLCNRILPWARLEFEDIN